MRDEHKIVPKECDYETANALFKTGAAAMIINGDWSLGDYKNIVNYDIAPLPMVSETGLLTWTALEGILTSGLVTLTVDDGELSAV